MTNHKDEMPPCFDSQEQWEAWQEMEAVTRSVGYNRRSARRVVSFCADCTVKYQDRMRHEGRCTNPDFKPDEKALTRHPQISKSGVKGVYYKPHSNRWCASKWHNGQTIWLGSFATKEEAAAAVEAYESNGTESEGDESEGLLLRNHGTLHEAGEGRVPERPIRIRRHFVSGEWRDTGSADDEPVEHERQN